MKSYGRLRRRLFRAFCIPLLVLRSERAFRYGRRHGIPGAEFGRFGKRVGRRLLRGAPLVGLDLLLTPVHVVRYFEFAFADAALPVHSVRCLDVSSPRLLSLYLASTGRAESILMLNPDARDVEDTRLITKRLKLPEIRVEIRGVESLDRDLEEFDAVWSISVLEHIPDDQAAIVALYGVLKPGGRLVVTVPVDRVFRVEKRSGGFYGTEGDERFFQRFYDDKSLRARLLDPLLQPPTEVRWFGERNQGRWSEYERSWIARGHAVTVDDPREIADEWQAFPSWDAMPGVGVCGFVVEKPR